MCRDTEREELTEQSPKENNQEQRKKENRERKRTEKGRGQRKEEARGKKCNVQRKEGKAIKENPRGYKETLSKKKERKKRM